MGVYEDFADHLASFRSAPFLFVGAGVARRYLGTETWVALLQHFAAMTPRPYAYYVTSGNGDLPQVASALADAFHDLWWNDERFEQSRQDFADSLTNRESPLKVEIAKHLAAAIADVPTSGRKADELALLKRAVIDGVITTNYDPLLEWLFPEFQVYVGQDELLFSDAQGVGEIYKIHGSCERPDSIILTADDFASFHDRNPYLAAKLLATFVEHPVIFLGYSLNDDDITEILVSIARVLTTRNLARLQDRLIVVTWDPDVQEPAMSRAAIAAQGFTIPVLTVTVAEYSGLFEALTKTRRKFPAKLLRQLKEHVYDLVLSNRPDGRLHVQDIDDETNIKDIDVVFGVGMAQKLSAQGYIGIGRRDLLEDVLQPASTYNARRVVREALPSVLRMPGNTPIFRYLREAGLLDEDGNVRGDVTLDERVSARAQKSVTHFLVPENQRRRAQRRLDESGGSFDGLVANNSLTDALVTIPIIPREDLDLDELRSFLLDNRAALAGPSVQPTLWSRLVCLYDYYAFGPGAAPTDDHLGS